MSRRRSCGLRASLFASAALGVFAWATQAAALPTGGTITGTSGGTVTISNSGTSTTVTSTAHRALIDWTSFAVASGETVTFNEPDKDAIVVNRQLTGSASYIDGYITSLVGGVVGGNVWIINPNGVVFGPSAHLNVGGLLATTSNLVSDSAFLSGADTDPVSFTANGAYAALVIDHGADIVVHDGSAVFIAGEILDYGTVTGTGSYQTDTKAVFATARDFTVRFGSNPPDPLRATDLDLFDLSATQGGGSLIMTNGASTTAGQVILDNFADLTTLPPGQYSNTEVEGATIDATGNRGDGFDLMIMTGDIVGGAPVGGVTSDKTIVTIAPSPAGTPGAGLPTTITSAGGLYVVGDEVLVNNQAGTYATFNVAGPSDLIGHVAVDLTDIGTLDTDVAGGSVVIDQNGVALTLGNVTATSDVTIDAGNGATISSISATGNLSLDVRYGLVAGDIHAASVYIGSYGPATIGNITASGPTVAIEETGGGSISTGNITAAAGSVFIYMQGDGGASLTTGAITAGDSVDIKSYQGDVAVGPVSAGNYAVIEGAGNVTIDGLSARSAYITAGGNYAYPGTLANDDIVLTGAVNVLSGTFIAGDIRVLAPISATATGGNINFNTPTGQLLFIANDMDVEAPITVTDTGGTGEILLFSKNPLGLDVGDNLSSPAGFQLSNAEFQYLQADTVKLVDDTFSLEAGIRIGDLTIDASKTPTVIVSQSSYSPTYADTISIEGTLQGIGNPSFMVGEPSFVGAGNVIVSGAIGTAANPFGYVYLSAISKIVLGSQAYLQEFLNDTNPGVFQPGLGGVATGHEFVSADTVVLETHSGGAILEQNTSATGEGIHITGSLTIAGQPYQVNLFGDLPDGHGGELYGQAAAASPDLLVSPGPTSPAWRFNGCHFGGGACQSLTGYNNYGLPYGGAVTGTSGGGVSITYNGPTMTVYSSAHRVIIDWTSFSIAAGDTVTFVEPDKNAIVVNRQMRGGVSDIYGDIESLVNGNVGGNVWIINPNGVLFGSGAQVNVGGFLASTSNLVSDSAFLTAGDNAPISFYGAGFPLVQLEAGANIVVHDGTAAFIGAVVTDSGAHVTGVGQYQTDTEAVFATARDFTIAFSSNTPGPLRATDLDLADLSATYGGAHLTMNYGATTTAGQVILDNFAFLTGLGAGQYWVTNVTGASINATGNRGNGFDLMLMSGDIVNGAPVGGVTSDKTIITIGPVNGTTPATDLTSAGGLYVSGDFVEINSTAGQEATFNIAGPTTIKANLVAQLTDIGDLDPTITGGAITIYETKAPLVLGNITASSVYITADHGVRVGDVTATSEVGISAHGGGTLTAGDIDAGNILLLSSDPVHVGTLTAADGVEIFASGAATVTTGDIKADYAVLQAYGSIDAGNIATAGLLQIHTFDAASITTGDIDAGQVAIQSGLAPGGGPNPVDPTATIAIGNVTSSGTVSLYGPGTITAGSINAAGADVYVRSYAGEIEIGSIKADGTRIIAEEGLSVGSIDAPSFVRAVAFDGTVSVGDITSAYVALQAGAPPLPGQANGPSEDIVISGAVNAQLISLYATGDVHVLAPLTAIGLNATYFPPSFPNAGEIIIHAADVDIEAPITATAPGGTGRIVLDSTNPSGLELGDGLANPSGFQISDAEFALLQAGRVYALENSQTAGVRIGNLTIDASKTPVVEIGAYNALQAYFGQTAAQTISVEGTVKGVGKPSLEIGFSTPYGGYEISYAPAHIVVSGAIGTAADPFGQVGLTAQDSIVIGSQAFAVEVAAGTAPDGWVEGLGGVADGHAFISAGDVVLSSPGAIVGQDTSPIGDGIHVTGSLTIEGDPTEVSLFGQLPNGRGEILYGAAAAGSSELFVIAYAGSSGPYRFNGCLFGGADCEPTVDIPVAGFAPPLFAPTAGVYAGASPATITANGTDLRSSPGDPAFGPLIVAPSALLLGGDRNDKDDQPSNRSKKKGQKSTVSGMGNEDHWPEGKQ